MNLFKQNNTTSGQTTSNNVTQNSITSNSITLNNTNFNNIILNNLDNNNINSKNQTNGNNNRVSKIIDNVRTGDYIYYIIELINFSNYKYYYNMHEEEKR